MAKSKTRKRHRPQRRIRRLKPGDKAVVTYRPNKEMLLDVPGWADVEIEKNATESTNPD